MNKILKFCGQVSRFESQKRSFPWRQCSESGYLGHWVHPGQFSDSDLYMRAEKQECKLSYPNLNCSLEWTIFLGIWNIQTFVAEKPFIKKVSAYGDI